MSLAFHARAAASAERSRRAMQLRGVTPNGKKLWTDAEIGILVKHQGSYEKMYEKLPNRSRGAIRAKYRSLGLPTRSAPRHRWTAFEISKLRKLYPSAEAEQICSIFPHSTWLAIRNVARYNNLRRRKQPYKITGLPGLDEVRRRCFDIGWSMADLDKAARTRKYFSKAGWAVRGKVNHRALGRAIEALDGVVLAQWK